MNATQEMLENYYKTHFAPMRKEELDSLPVKEELRLWWLARLDAAEEAGSDG